MGYAYFIHLIGAGLYFLESAKRSVADERKCSQEPQSSELNMHNPSFLISYHFSHTIMALQQQIICEIKLKIKHIKSPLKFTLQIWAGLLY